MANIKRLSESQSRPLSDKYTLNRRQVSLSSHAQAGIVIAVVVVGIFCVILVSYILLRFLRIRHDNPRYIPGAYLKAKWQRWEPSSAKKQSSGTSHDRPSMLEVRNTTSAPLGAMLNSSGLDISSRDLAAQGDEEGPDRRTSLRSVMTLPAYTADARPCEKILGREGDRGGIDTVVEFSDTAEDDEARREEEMESLYQIRAARRQERANRADRRQARRAARARGDSATLQRLRTEDASTTTLPNGRDATAMLREHQARDRGRRISSVSYMDLGVARHDGSRVRAGSHDSDRPLLDDQTTLSSRRGSMPRSLYQAHLRNQSTSSLRFATPDYSGDERGSSEFDFTFTSQDMSRRPSTARRSSLPASMHHNSENVNRLQPSCEPPRYDLHLATSQSSSLSPAAPAYESPTATNAPRRGQHAPLPAVEITPFRPDVGAPVADIQSQAR